MYFRQFCKPSLLWVLVATAFPSYSNSCYIDWVDCGQNPPIAFSFIGVTPPTTDLPSTLHCGKVVVPMDYSKPISSCNNITLSVAMYRPAKPKGVIFYNGGGGDPNTVVAWLVSLGLLNTFDGLLDYDLMMMDTRGTFDSNRLNISDVGLAAAQNSILGPFPTTQQEFDAAKAGSAVMINDVEKWTSPPGIVKHISAREVAHDYEQIRIALGYEKVNFIALSYGTYRANTYAAYYPERVGNFVLDAVVPHNVTAYYAAQTQIAALNRAMYRADAFCINNSSCPFHDQGKGGFLAAYKKLLASAPLFVSAFNATVTAFNIQQIVADSLESEGVDFPTLFQNVSDPLHGDATNLALSPLFPPNVGIILAGSVLLECGDNNFQKTTFPEWQKSIETGLANDPNQIGQPLTWELQLGCLAWPYPTPSYASLYTEIPMVLVTSDFDGGLPTEWADMLREQAHNSVLVVRHGDDHTTFSLSDQPATALMKQFLATGKLPTAMSNSRVSVYTPGMIRAPLPDPYSVPTGEIAGDVNTGNLTESEILP